MFSSPFVQWGGIILRTNYCGKDSNVAILFVMDPIKLTEYLPIKLFSDVDQLII